MKTETIWLIVGAVILILIFVIIYNRYIKFPHAKVLNHGPAGVTWSNGITSATIKPDCTGVAGGTYNRKYDWEAQCLPNNQFRFIVFEQGNKFAKVVDNIFSFSSSNTYLTK